MEKVLSPEERIRKAEELYYRRKVQSINKQTARVNVNDKSNYKSSKKFIKQIMVCILIYLLWYGFQNSNYIFSQNVIHNLKQVLEYDISLLSLYSKINKEEPRNQIENIKEEATVETSTTAVEETLSNSEEFTENEVIESEVIPLEEASSIDQMKEDAEYIKSNYDMVKPLLGTITSRFGVRESENPNVAGYHTGLDIAVNEGTVFAAAMSGTVELVSSVGSLRKSF